MENTPRRSTRIRKAPVPIYVPDPDTKFEDDYDQSSEDESALIDGGDDYDDDDSEYDSSEDEGLPRTKAGYALDDFIVEDTEMDSEIDDLNSEEEEDDDYISSDDE